MSAPETFPSEHEITLTVRVVVRSAAPDYPLERAQSWAAVVVRQSAAHWAPNYEVRSVEVSR